MKARRLKLKNCTVFDGADFEFSPGLNAFIGANATGKSHVLKLLYSVLRPMAGTWSNGTADDKLCQSLCERLGRPILEKLRMTFRAEPGRSPLSSLIRHGRDEAEFSVEGDFGTVRVNLHGSEANTEFLKVTPSYAPAVYVPVNEALSMYPGFVAAFERRELSFDETYRDLCVDLSAAALKTDPPPGLAAIVKQLDEAVGGKTQLRGEKFFVSLAKNWLLESPMMAEGLRKLGSIAHLIRNGSLAENGVLCWDEPETSLNPRLIPRVARTLLALAGAEIQVFVATHDYLLTNELSLAVEYRTAESLRASPRFFALAKPGPVEPIVVESGETLADLGHNPILEEFAAHYDRQQYLSRGSEEQEA